MNKSIRKFGKTVLLSALLLGLLFSLAVHARADGAPQVEIAAGEPQYGEKGFTVDVTVVFHDASLYNEKVLLSYHILSVDGNETLAFENPRLPLAPDGDGIARLTVSVDSVSQPLLEGMDAARICFDLVDEANVFWFLDNPNVDIKTAEVQYDALLLIPASADTAGPEPASAGGETKTNAVLPIIFCGIGWIAATVLIVCARKSGLLRFRKAAHPDKHSVDHPAK